ncbi:fungal-specific transcription factor domain-containing protein [Hypoxylon trugodes]|uniref:fungal-specific transcription factor domain-containing protein n=1 Tax=Hypoxylon trugodes TaxID=326681 RepID=UPI00218D60A1|nr:fungal-specific transcription factor domain-containing protein [Hypoxylon trugodes]KAI1394427.1 fungal-specific transcription factor domain-containing protein [Hypoxylon trugodes]
MESMGQLGRPYRSHLRPACLPCRKRKSRCNVEAHSTSCLMCRTHGTQCAFPSNQHQTTGPVARRSIRRHTTPRSISRQPVRVISDGTSAGDIRTAIINDNGPVTNAVQDSSTALQTNLFFDDREDHPGSTPLSIEDTENENPHVISPAITSDSQVLMDCLSTLNSEGCGIRLIRPKRTTGNRSVLFTAVEKRPVGLAIGPNPSYTKCQIIEKLLEPWGERLINAYFKKGNSCFPLLDEKSFRRQYTSAKEQVSPALLSSLYAHGLVYWKSELQPIDQRSPDVRFIWNLASEALQSELFLSPGISTLTAILLNIGGRPTTALVGNGIRLGSAVSLAYALGLNRDPLSWDISWSEKMLRMHTWWALLTHDRWSSLAYGTPPHIQKSFCDVPQPKVEYQFNANRQEDTSANSVFVALSGLTDILDHYLQYLYRIDKETSGYADSLELGLNRWVENLEPNIRPIIVRGASLNIPGAPNLRLAYLSMKLLTHRIRMEEIRSRDELVNDALANQYIQTRRTAEDIVFFVQQLQEEHLQDFWLPVSAFAFPSTITFLLRSALEAGRSPSELAKSTSIKLALDLITALRRHKEYSGWDLGDICLAQHAEIVEKLASPVQTDSEHNTTTIYGDMLIPDDLFSFNDIFS